jgi:hypothetical protein
MDYFKISRITGALGYKSKRDGPGKLTKHILFTKHFKIILAE